MEITKTLELATGAYVKWKLWTSTSLFIMIYIFKILYPHLKTKPDNCIKY